MRPHPRPHPRGLRPSAGCAASRLACGTLTSTPSGRGCSARAERARDVIHFQDDMARTAHDQLRERVAVTDHALGKEKSVLRPNRSLKTIGSRFVCPDGGAGKCELGSQLTRSPDDNGLSAWQFLCDGRCRCGRQGRGPAIFRPTASGRTLQCFARALPLCTLCSRTRGEDERSGAVFVDPMGAIPLRGSAATRRREGRPPSRPGASPWTACREPGPANAC